MKISELADQVRGIPLRDVLTHHGFEVKPEGTTLRAKDAHHNIVVTGSRWFDNKAGIGGGGAIDLVMHISRVGFSAACRSLADEFLPLGTGQTALSFPKRWQESPHAERKSFVQLAALYAVREESNWPIARAYLVEQRKVSLPRWWMSCTLEARSMPMIIGPIRALFFSTVTSTERCAEQLFEIPDISPHSVRALEISSPPGSRSENLPRRTA